MAPSYLVFTPAILHVIIYFMSGGCFSHRWKALPDNCTCARIGHPTYSLFSLREERIYGSGFLPHPDYMYTFMPCVPDNLHSRKGHCMNVALCKYDKPGKPPVYTDIGEQRDVLCETTDEYELALIYPINVNKTPTTESKVIIECNNNSLAEPVLNLISEDKLIFSLNTHCGCANQCSPPKPTTAPVPPKPNTAPVPASIHNVPSDSSKSNWELVILLPSLAGFFAVLICFLSLRRWQLGAIRFRSCPCCDENNDQVRIEPATENTALIRNQQNNQAVEHEDPGGNGKLKEPVQEGDMGEVYKFIGKDSKTVVV